MSSVSRHGLQHFDGFQPLGDLVRGDHELVGIGTAHPQGYANSLGFDVLSAGLCLPCNFKNPASRGKPRAWNLNSLDVEMSHESPRHASRGGNEGARGLRASQLSDQAFTYFYQIFQQPEPFAL